MRLLQIYLFALFLLTGCTLPSPAPAAKFRVQLQPIIVEPFFDTPLIWNDRKIKTQIKVAQKVHALAGVELVFKPTTKRAELFFTFMSVDAAAVSESGRQHSKRYGEVLIWFVNGISLNSGRADGIGSQPDNRRKFRYILVIAAGAYDCTLAHELGHYFGLDHTWDDSLEDTPWEITNLSRAHLNNIMSYGRKSPSASNLHLVLTPEQIAQIRTTLVNSPRNQIAKELP